MIRKKILLTLVLLIASSIAVATTAVTPKHEASKDKIPPRPTQAINTYINQLVKDYQFNKAKLTYIMSQAKYDPKVIHWITHPFEKKPWGFYRHFFLQPARIDNGAKYWHEHQKVLEDVQNRYGVNASVIIAIIGVESDYGTRIGDYNVLNALTTLSFYYPKRAKFFKSELTQYLLLTRQEKLNPLVLKGSYAGALGIPQFMPSSYGQYGVDYSKNHSINLFTDHNDAIASIGNYLKQAGWILNKPVAVPAMIKGKVPKQLISQTATPRYSLKKFRQYGIRPTRKIAGNPKAALIVMQSVDSKQYWLVFRNFKAIMRYNPRTTYALAVYELSEAIKKKYYGESTS